MRLLPPRRGPVRETIVTLAGGPGEQATPHVHDHAVRLGATGLRGRRLVAFDQRGTTYRRAAGALRCPSLRRIDGDRALHAAVAACARRLGAAWASYATADSVADLEALRVALGAPKLTLLGISYGTKVALDYAARHPDRVERLVLDSVVPRAGVDPFRRSTATATPRVLRDLCANACPFTRDSGDDLARLLGRLRERGPLQGRWFDRHGQPRQVAIDTGRLLDLFVDGDRNPLLRMTLPAALHAAVGGDTAPLARLLAPARFDERGMPAADDALSLATRCLDGVVPWPAGTPIAQRAQATSAALAALPATALAPFDAAAVRANGLLDLCRAWPESPLPQTAGSLPDVPALLLAGGQDLRTPREDAQAVAAQLPRARLVTVPAAGHSVLGWEEGDGCATRALRRFLDGGDVADCPQASRRDRWPVLPPVPARLAALTPRPGLPVRVGRTVAALEATFDELEWQRFGTIASFMDSDWDIDDPRQPRLGWGGLRGGRAIARDELQIGRYAIERYVVVGGVRVSGDARLTDPDGVDVRYRLRVGGAAAARGVVTIDKDRIRGRLDGRRIDLRNRYADPFAPPPPVTRAPGGMAPAATASADSRGRLHAASRPSRLREAVLHDRFIRRPTRVRRHDQPTPSPDGPAGRVRRGRRPSRDRPMRRRRTDPQAASQQPLQLMHVGQALDADRQTARRRAG